MKLRTSPPPRVVWLIAGVLALLGLLGALGLVVVLRPFWLVFIAWLLLAATTVRGL